MRPIASLRRAFVLPLLFAAAAPRSEVALDEVIFVNGINNTFEGALENAVGLRELLRNTETRSGSAKRNFRVWLQYNEAGWALPLESIPGVGLLRDVAELAALKVSEECYLNRLIDISHRYDQPIPIDRGAASDVVSHLVDMVPGSGTASQQGCGQNSLVTDGIVSSDRMEPLKGVATSLTLNVQQLKKVAIVAHSEGNILANLAYASIAATVGDNVSRMLRIVNVANTSALSMHQLDATHNKDGALALLATLGTYLTRSTVECGAPGGCPFPLAPATLKASNQLLIFPTLGHSFSGTYLSETETEPIGTSAVPFSAGANKFADRVVDYVYAAAAALDSANSITVSAAGCDSPLVGRAMTCTITGSNLPPGISLSASNCNPAPMTEVAGGSSMQRQYSCVPQILGQVVSVSYVVPGFVGVLPAFPTSVALNPPLPAPNATNPLNDTGSAVCFTANGVAPSCTGVDAISLNDKQDGMVGRDVTAPQAADGALGFSFELVPNGSGGTFAKTECVRDKVTGLMWEGKPTSGSRGVNLVYYETYIVARPEDAQAYAQFVNSIGLCGYSDWRLPTREELHGIVHYGAALPPGPAVDLDWFPNTPGTFYRTAKLTSNIFNWAVDFGTGEVRGVSALDRYRVRLVR